VAADVPHCDAWAGADLLLGNVEAPEAIGARVTLQPWEARVHRRAT
jgi:oligo-1,6-glucosidase